MLDAGEAGDGGEKGEEGGKGGGEAPPAALSWDQIKQAIPEALRGDKALEPITSLEGLTKSFIHAQKAIGKDKVTVPDKHATPEDWQALFSKLGNPEKIDDYAINLEGDMAMNEEMLNKVKMAAHEAGVLPWQFEKIVNTFNKEGIELQNSTSAADEANYNKMVEGLKDEWGDAYDTKIRAANVAFKEFMPNQEEREAFIEAGLGSDPRVVKLLANASKLLKEDVFVGHGDGVNGKMTPSEALEKARAIQGDDSHPYRNPAHPNHKSAKDEVASLYKVAFPD
jgi:hypothetical protein